MNYSWSRLNSASDNVNFRLWASGVSDAFLAIGMVPEDKSTVANNWNTTIVGYTNSANQSDIAWEVWRFPNSATQTAAPLYVRVGYGTGSTTSSTRLTFKFGASYSTNPSGTITGVCGSTTYDATFGNANTTTAYTSYAACDNHGFVFVMCPTATTASMRQFFAVDRHRDSNGDPLTTGFAFYRGYNGQGSVVSHHFGFISNDLAVFTGPAPCVTQGSLSTTLPNVNDDGDTLIYPWWSVTVNGHGVSKMVATYAQPDIVPLIDQQVRWLPSTGSPTVRTVKGVGSFISNAFDIHSSAGASLAIWWDD